MWNPFIDSATLLFVLLNPFLMSIYLLDLISRLNTAAFRAVTTRGAAIAATVFIIFALTGDMIFRNLLHVRFASFLIFGGVIFLVIGIRFVLIGSAAITSLRGPAEHVAGSIAMPFMIGPATVSASVLAGARMPWFLAVLAIVTALVATSVCVIVIKTLHDHISTRNQSLVNRYVDIVGRISALVIGTVAVEMIAQGVELWLASL